MRLCNALIFWVLQVVHYINPEGKNGHSYVAHSDEMHVKDDGARDVSEKIVDDNDIVLKEVLKSALVDGVDNNNQEEITQHLDREVVKKYVGEVYEKVVKEVLANPNSEVIEDVEREILESELESM